MDDSGNAYIAGGTRSTDFPTAGPLQAHSEGGADVFVTKIDASGAALVYSAYLGGSGDEGASGIAIDAVGNAYVTGYTYSTDFPIAAALQDNLAGDGDAFVMKIDTSGSALLYSTYFGGNGGDYAAGIAVDVSGNAYISGSTDSTNLPTANPLQGSLAGDEDAFVAKFDASGSALVYSTYLGGSSDERGCGIATDASGNGYVAGYTSSTNFPTALPLQTSLAGDYDAFVTKIDASGSAFVYSTYLGGSEYDDGADIAVDDSGHAYVTGGTFSTDFPLANPFQAGHAGYADAFVTKIDASGSAVVYSTYLGGSDHYDSPIAIAVDGSGSAYLTGCTASRDFPLVDALQPSKAGGYDAFVTKLDASGSALGYSTYLGGDTVDFTSDCGTGIAVDGSGNAYVTGFTSSANFPTAKPLQGSLAGPRDAFVLRIGRLYDDFEDGDASDWTATNSSLQTVVDGALRLEMIPKRMRPVPRQGPRYNWTFPSFVVCGTCAIEAHVKPRKPRTAASLLGWYRDASHYGMVTLVEGANRLTFNYRDGGTSVARTIPYTVAVGESYLVRVAYEAGIFRVSVDGVPVLMVAVSGKPSGRVGFRVGGGVSDRPQAAEFGEIREYGPEQGGGS